MSNKVLFDQLRKINGTLTQLQVDTLNELLATTNESIFYDLFGIVETKNMNISSIGKDLIKEFEGLRLSAYDDGVGVWTIGYGTTIYPNKVKVKRGDACTKEQAETYLSNDLKAFEATVNSSVTVSLTQNQYDALVSITYNIGSGAFKNSTLLRKLNAGDYKGAADQFLVWNKGTIGGKKVVIKGLDNRRHKERNLFLK